MQTLAQFIQQKRDNLGLSPSGLARKSNVRLDVIEDIEAGKELFLPVTIRQNLAKALKCSPEEIKILEKSFLEEAVSKEVIDVLKQRILNGEVELICPKCGNDLVVRIEKMYDLENNLVLEPKGYCSKCVFQII